VQKLVPTEWLIEEYGRQAVLDLIAKHHKRHRKYSDEEFAAINAERAKKARERREHVLGLFEAGQTVDQITASAGVGRAFVLRMRRYHRLK
jgi:hypothetical protein